MFKVLPSEYVPVAVNCRFDPRAINGDCGESEMETRVGLMVRLAGGDVTEPRAAVMNTVPEITVDARPWLPALLLMVAILVLSELHVTEVVIVCVLLSL